MTQRSYSAYISPEKRGFLVSVFTFEIFQPDDTPSVSNVLKLAKKERFGFMWKLWRFIFKTGTAPSFG